MTETESTAGPAQSTASVVPVPYRMRIGVTGHRGLESEPAVRQAVERLLARLDETLHQSAAAPRSGAAAHRSAGEWLDRALLLLVKALWWSMPITPGHVPAQRQVPLAWCAVSALAGGSDQVLAEVVLDRLGGTLHAILPFESGQYMHDFEAGGAEDRFRSLLDRANHVETASNLAAGEGDAQTRRVRGYRLAGERVVDESDLIVAVWDGAPSRGEGGTAETVAYAVERNKPVYWIDAKAPEREPLRLSDPRATGPQPFTRRPLPKTAKEIAPRYHQVCAYFRDPAFQAPQFQAIYRRERHSLQTAANETGLDPAVVADRTEARLAQHAYADHLAIRHQTSHIRSTGALFVFAAAAVTMAAVHLLVFKHFTPLIWLEIAFMLGAVVLLRVSRRERWHEKWLYDRYLAERLRGRMFLEAIGLPQSEIDGTHRPLPFYGKPSGWIDTILREAALAAPVTADMGEVEPVRNFLRDAWIGAQATWHARNAKKKESAERRFRAARNALFLLTLMCAILHLMHFGEEHGFVYLPGVPEVVKVLAVALPAWGATVHGIGHLLDHERIAHRSQHMHHELSEAVRDLEGARDMDAVKAVAKRVEELMAVENLEWMMTLSHHKPELHV